MRATIASQNIGCAVLRHWVFAPGEHGRGRFDPANVRSRKTLASGASAPGLAVARHDWGGDAPWSPVRVRQFEEFMGRYQNLVFTTAMRYLGQEAEAEDIAQEVFLKAYERFGQLYENPAAGGWLRKVARNLSLNYLSRFRRRWRLFSELSTEENDAGFESDLAAPEIPEREGDASERKRLLEIALQKLNPAQRTAMVLFHYQDLSYKTIAQRLGVSLGKVKRDIFRGRETLRHKLMLNSSGELEWRKKLVESWNPAPGLA